MCHGCVQYIILPASTVPFLVCARVHVCHGVCISVYSTLRVRHHAQCVHVYMCVPGLCSV